MDDKLQNIAEKAGRGRNFDSPPLELWHPPLSGDIPIRIAADGSWYHEGSPITRQSLVRLFASILRREDDGEYYLVTPREKWRIEVELHPLIVVDFDFTRLAGENCVQATLNTGRQVALGRDHELFLEQAIGGIAALKLDHGLSALCSRTAWYRLVEMATDRDGTPVIVSGGYMFALQ